METTTLWRPVGAYELALIAQAQWKRFPPRLPEQPIFYPVCNIDYAREIAFRWNPEDPNSGFAGFVTEFATVKTYADGFERRIVGARRHEELWVPAEQLAEFCSNLVGPIRVVDGMLGDGFSRVASWSGVVGRLSGESLGEAVRAVSEGHLVGGPLTQQ